MPASHQSSITVSAERSEVFEACLKAVQECGFRVVASNPETGQIEARTKMGIRSWGEIITITVGAEGTVDIKSSCRGIQMVDYGKNKANVNALSSALGMLVPRPPQQ
ncbi:MAG TPA: hypothetical protein VGA04_23085 [Streptosporangiaceae bacterium]|jgi:hypothetical protein